MPWPSSTLPVNTVAVPSALMRSQRVELAVGLQAAGQPRGLALRQQVGRRERKRQHDAAHAPLANERRGKNGSVHGQVLPPVEPLVWPPILAGAQHRADDPVVGAAATEIAGQRLLHLALRWRSACGRAAPWPT